MRTSSSSSISSTRIGQELQPCSTVTSRAGARQVDDEAGAALVAVARAQRAAEGAHELRRDHQPQAEPGAGRLAGDEGLEQARQDVGADARAGVASRSGSRARLSTARRRRAARGCGASCIASIALRIRLTSTLLERGLVGHARPASAARTSTSTRDAVRLQLGAEHVPAHRRCMRQQRPAARGSSLLCAKVFSCEVSRASRSTMPRDALQVAAHLVEPLAGRAGCRRCRTACAAPSAAGSARAPCRPTSGRARAILPACTSSLCAARSCGGARDDGGLEAVVRRLQRGLARQLVAHRAAPLPQRRRRSAAAPPSPGWR